MSHTDPVTPLAGFFGSILAAVGHDVHDERRHGR